MKYVNCFLIAVLFSTGAAAQIRGGGSTFAQDLYMAWNDLPSNQRGGNVAYTANGSGEGVRAAQAGTVDFGATERPLSREELARSRLAQIPAALGGVVVIANLKPLSADTVTLNGAVLADIFLGSIKLWNDPAIRALNPNLQLPSLAISPVVRSSGSGTSFVFGSYLGKTSPKWKSAASGGAVVAPGAAQVPSNKAMADAVLAKAGAIGFVEFSFSQELGIPAVKLVNKWGTTVSPTADAIKQTVQAADWELIRSDTDPTFELDLVDAGCPRCWPISTATYALVPLRTRNTDRVIEFMRNGLTQGDEATEKLGYVALPTRAEGIVRAFMNRWTKPGSAINQYIGANIDGAMIDEIASINTINFASN